ncbi:MAG: EamA family transporter [Bacteroidia bacterium]|nr:EamA family transporter [Bacteroidia bacterium]
MSQPPRVSNPKAFLILALLALTWGTSFILIKKALLVFNPYQVAGLRVFIASLAFIPIILINWKKINWKRWPLFIAVGFCGTMIPSFLFPLAQTNISSSMAGILNAIAPIFTLLIGILFFKKAFELRKGMGIALGFIGAALLISAGSSMDIDQNSWYGIYAVLAGVLYSFSSNIIENYFSDMSALNISAASFGIMGPIALIVLLVFQAPQTIIDSDKGLLSLGYVTILALFSTVMASVVFFYLIQRTSAVFSSTVAYVIPIVALMWGAIDGELITLHHFIGMGLILAGVYFSRGG